MPIHEKAAVIIYIVLAIIKANNYKIIMLHVLSLISRIPDIWHLPDGYDVIHLVPGWVIKYKGIGEKYLLFYRLTTISALQSLKMSVLCFSDA